jgi:hypothetical protein
MEIILTRYHRGRYRARGSKAPSRRYRFGYRPIERDFQIRSNGRVNLDFWMQKDDDSSCLDYKTEMMCPYLTDVDGNNFTHV